MGKQYVSLHSGVNHVLLAADAGRLASPAVLGDTVEVRSELVGTDTSKRLLLWKQHVAPLHAAPGTKAHAACVTVSGFVDARGQLHALPSQLLDELPVDEKLTLSPLTPSGAPPVVETSIILYSMELSGLHGTPTETDILRWFERNRTDIIGGGAGLKQLQQSHTLVVVTSVNNFRIDASAAAAHVRPHQVVHIRSGITTKRKGVFIVFHQEAWVDGHLLAAAEVTCACVDANTMGLAPAAPPPLLELLTASEPRTQTV